MERNKPGTSRSGKSKPGVPHHGSELFALGSKSSSKTQKITSDDAKISKVISSTKSTDRKRDAPTSLASVTVKKPKIASIGSSSSSRLDGASSSSALEYWEQVAVDCETVDLIQSVLSAIEQQNSDTVIALVCGAIRTCVASRPKPDTMLLMSLLYLAKIRPQLFCNEVVTTALISILKRDTGHRHLMGRINPVLHVLAANLLARGYHNKTQWPITFVQIYIDDAINDRVWVDYEDCNAFVENVCTAFGTKVPPKAMLQPELMSLLSRDATNMDDDSGEASSAAETVRSSSEINIDCPVQPRYAHLTVEKLVLDSVKDLLNRRQAPDSSTRNLLRFLSATSGISEIRALASYGGRLEHWMHNSKLQKPAQELLTYICYNVTVADNEVLANLVKMRLKSKPLINIYMNCLKEMITVQPSILFIVLKNVVQNELSSVRNPNNMGMLACMFQAKPEESAQHLAEIYQELLMQREDCLRTLRVFLRELVKMLRFDIKLTVFCNKLLTMNKTLISQCDTLDYRDRIFYSMVDLECLCMFLSVSPQIKEAIVSMRAGRENRGSKVLYEFYEQMSILQHDGLQWMCNVVPIVFKPTDGEYSQSLHKILFLDSPEQYSKVDQWPPEQERSLLIRLVSEIPLHEDSIMYIIRIGITKEIPFKVPDTVEMIEQVIRRAAGLKVTDFPPLLASNLKIIEYLFVMAEYHHPGNIALPLGYEPPKLAISLLYWKAWNMLLMLSAHNPSTFGAFCWEQYPMLRNLMEMCITNQFTDSKIPEEELQMNALERTHILEFETHLAAATSKLIITDQTSLLLSQLMLMDPFGVARRPPNHILEQLQQQNASLKLGHLLCRSRKPDLLLDIIQRQGSSQSMPWLADLVQNSEGDFNDLPVQCLCEFLLSNSSNISTENSRDVELLTYLQKLLSDETGDHQTSCEVLEYFLRRLSSTCKQSRQMAIKGLRLLLKVFQKEVDGVDHNEYVESDWLLRYLPMMPFFPSVRLIVIIQLRAACQIENNPDLVMIYIQFIAANTLHDSVPDMLEHVMDMSQLIVERSTIFSCIIPTSDDCTDEERLQTLNCLFVMFNNYLIKLREHKAPLTWPEYPDLLTVNFADGTTLPIHLNIIQAFVILLTYSTMIPNPQAILDYWFPIDVPPPSAYTIDTSEQVQILPDWLKLKMIRSSVERLVDAALLDLTPDQIILFVQNFGTPVNSMSKLLALLDRAVIEQFETVKSTIMNKTYLSQLIEIQQARGAKNGHIAVQALELHGQVIADPPKREVIVVEPLTVDMTNIEPKPPISRTKEIEEIVDVVLTNQIMTKSHNMRFRRLMQQLIAKDVPNKKMSPKLQVMYGSQSKMQQYAQSTVVQYLGRLCTGPNAVYLRQQNLQRSTICSLFRSLLPSQPGKLETMSFLTQIIDQLLQHVVDIRLNPVILQILLNKRKVLTKSTEGTNPMDKQDLIQVLDTANMMELEKKGKKVLNSLFKETDSSYLVNAITLALKTSEKVKIEGTQSDKIGLLVDWLADIDSELVVANTSHQMDLLFSRSLRQFRFYMLSLLSHQASWTTLHSTLNKILGDFNPNYDPTSVLHFVGAFIRNPKLWQGRDKATPKHEQVEHVLDLNSNQIRVFADYILSESVVDPEKLTHRVEVLLKCVHRNEFQLNKLISYVRKSDVDVVVQKKFLQQLYLNFPPMKFLVEDLNDVYKAEAKNLSGCLADTTTNYVLTTISSLSATKDFQSMSSDMELMVRKLAASHPSLILRQLSVLSSLLQGRAHMDLSVLRVGHHMTLFHQVLGILEILQPQVFEEPYTDTLHQALECYFTLLQYHANSKDTSMLMYRFMELLQAYTNKNANKALNFIEPYADLIQYLSSKNRHIISLQQIVQGVSLLKHRHTHDFSFVDRSEDISEDVKPSTSAQEPNSMPSTSQQELDSTGAAAVILAPYAKQNLTPQHWPQLIKTVLHRNGEEILGALQEIEMITSKRQGLIEPLFERILELLESPNAIIRNTAHTLLVRHLKFNPGNSVNNSKALVAYIQCLRVSDPAVVTSALEVLTEIVICLQEFASDILKIVFDLGIQSRLNTFDQLRRCIVALKTQHAC